MISQQRILNKISVLKVSMLFNIKWRPSVKIIVHFVLCALIASTILLTVARADDATTELATTTTTPATRAPVQAGAHDVSDTGTNTTIFTTRKRRTRTTPRRETFKEDCDFLAYYCMKAYQTGQLCGRTVYYRYATFVNYCMLDYVNCMERYEVWQVVHMGECFNITPLTDYVRYEYLDDFFLDQYYVIQD